MEELAIGNQCKLIYGKNNKIGALLFYNPNKKNGPLSTVSYWEYDKDFRKMNIEFDSQIYGTHKIEQYWKKILELDKDKKLTMNTLCDVIDEVFFKDKEKTGLENKTITN
jgi:hypothetical protein